MVIFGIVLEKKINSDEISTINMKQLSNDETLRASDIFLFQLGNANAIRRIITSPWALLVGVVLVWTAGIARHYDFRRLHIEHQWIWAPFLVVLVSSFLIYSIFHLACYAGRGSGARFFRQYAGFFSAFLFTAPIAWFYAIPIEHAFPGDPLTCAKINIGLLALVSFWRVWLMTRMLVVASKAGWVLCLGTVLLGASIEAFFGGIFKQLDVVGLMGGFELSPTQEFLSSSYSFIVTGSIVSAVIALLMVIIGRYYETREEPFPGFGDLSAKPKGALIGVGVLLMVWQGIATPFQLNQELRKPRIELEKLARPNCSAPTNQ